MNNNETHTNALDALLAKMVDAYAADVAAQIVARYRADEAVLSHNADLAARLGAAPALRHSSLLEVAGTASVLGACEPRRSHGDRLPLPGYPKGVPSR